jgi:hypothetical protein
MSRGAGRAIGRPNAFLGTYTAMAGKIFPLPRKEIRTISLPRRGEGQGGGTQ